MVALDKNNMKWRMEVQNATASLGSVRLAQRRFAEAAELAEKALNTIEALTTADPNNRDYRQSLVDSLAWSADVERDAGHIDKAIAVRERHAALLGRLLSETGDSAYRSRLSTAERKLGFLYAVHGDGEHARQHSLAAIAQGEQLTAIEPNNNMWLGILAEDKTNLAFLLLMSGKPDEAAVQNEASCAIAGRLVAKDPSITDWRGDLRECWTIRSYVALARHANDEAATAAEQAIRVARSGKSPDAAADAFALGAAYRLLGDARSHAGNKAAAVTAWQTALAALPRVPAERPFETHEHAIILKRLGRTAEAQQLDEKLARIGYRLPDLEQP
jgi:tetratricopeptide (TPR) repeat protein